MGDRIAELVTLHIPAKRYLVTTDPTHRANLSPLSIHTLGIQGGDMTPTEVKAFESGRYWRDAVRLRRADEAAKVPGRTVPDLDYWRPALRAVANS